MRARRGKIQRTIVVTACDVCGNEEDVKQVTFDFAGGRRKQVQMDLCVEHMECVEELVSHAKRRRLADTAPLLPEAKPRKGR